MNYEYTAQRWYRGLPAGYDVFGGCEACDGDGRVWNNADPTSGQWVPCEECSA